MDSVLLTKWKCGDYFFFVVSLTELLKKLSSCWHEKTWPSCDVTVTELAVCSWKTIPRRWSRSTSVTPVTPWACNMWRIMDGHVGWLHKEGYISLWENKPAMDNDTNGLPTFWPLDNVVCSAVVTGHIWNSGHSRSSMVTWWWLYRRLLATRLSQPNLLPEGRSVHTKWFQRNGPATTDETIGLSAPLMIWPQTLNEQARVLVYRHLKWSTRKIQDFLISFTPPHVCTMN